MNRVRQIGFTLVELTVVLIIIALLIGGMLVPMSAQNDMRNRQETEKALAEIKEALIGFAAVNGRLPCPAEPSVGNSAANAGWEAVPIVGGVPQPGPCTCSDVATSGIAKMGASECDPNSPSPTSSPTDRGSVTGVLPWATLGLRETDAWGQRFTYRVTTRFGRTSDAHTDDFGDSCPPPPSTSTSRSAFALCSKGAMTVTNGSTTIASEVPAIVVSHGRNGRGGYMTNGSQVSGAENDELENRITGENETGNIHNLFISKSPIDEPTTVYDDLTVWVTTNILMSRMIAVGRLP